MYSAADVDRTAGRDARVDHLQLLANMVRWAVGLAPVLEVTGTGRVDCHLYAKQDVLVLHIVNTASSSSIPGTHDELLPVGPFEIRLRFEGITSTSTARALVGETDLPVECGAGELVVTVPSSRGPRGSGRDHGLTRALGPGRAWERSPGPGGWRRVCQRWRPPGTPAGALVTAARLHAAPRENDVTTAPKGRACFPGGPDITCPDRRGLSSRGRTRRRSCAALPLRAEHHRHVPLATEFWTPAGPRMKSISGTPSDVCAGEPPRGGGSCPGRQGFLETGVGLRRAEGPECRA